MSANSESPTKVAVIGLGYVGLPLALAVAKQNFRVYGIDKDPVKIASLRIRKSYIEDIEDKELGSAINNETLIVTNDYSVIKEVSVVVICVPTPTKEGIPDLSILIEAIDQIAPHLSSSTLVISESSSYPGTLRSIVAERLSTLKDGGNIYIAHAPERVDPRNNYWKINNTPRLISGIDEQSLARAIRFYESFCDNVVPVSSPEVAEAAKMFENTYRLVNISLVNEFARYCHKIGVEATEVFEAAATKPYGFKRFFHGAGAGGHCIPVDPQYVAQHARKVGQPLSLVESALKVNDSQVQFVFERSTEILNSEIKARNVLVIGLGYKAGTSDLRESRGIELLKCFSREGANIFWHDERIEDSPLGVKDSEDRNYDLAIQLSYELFLDYSEIHARCEKILDCTGSVHTNPKVVRL